MIKRLFQLVSLLMTTLPAFADLTWHWSNPLPHGNNIIGLGYHAASGQTIQACDSGQIYTSTDWSTWTPRDSQTTNTLQSITCLGNRLLITGANGTVVYSDDGATFTCTNVGTTDWLVGVAASASLAVAVGDNAAIYTSLDGARWKRQAAPPNVGTHWLLATAFGDGVFVTVGEGGYIATSRDGTNWIRRTMANLTNDLNAVVWIGAQGAASGLPSNSFLAAGDSGKVVMSVNDGTNWSNVAQTGTNLLYAIAGNDSAHLLAGDGSVRLGRVVLGALAWREQVGSGAQTVPSSTYYSALYGASACAVGGVAGIFVTGAPNLLTGAMDWTAGGSGVHDWLFQVTSIGGSYVAVGERSRILTSDDGAAWSIEQVPSTNSVSSTNTVFFGIGGSTNLLIAVGNQGSVALSTNLSIPAVTTNSDGTLSTNSASTLGLAWTPIPAPTTNDLHGVAQFMGTNFLCGGTGTILSSPDGIVWTKRTCPTTAYLSALETYSGGLVCVGDTGVILTSPNGVTWTRRISGTTNWVFRVRNLNGTLLAVGENGTILSSTNAVNWTARASGVASWLNDAVTISNACYVVSSDGTVLTSTNFATWHPIPVITENSLYGCATLGGQLVTVGSLGTILRSQVIPSTTPITFLEYSKLDGSDYFEAAGDQDQAFTLDSSADLINWTTGPLLNITDSSGTVIFSIDSPANSQTFYRATLSR